MHARNRPRHRDDRPRSERRRPADRDRLHRDRQPHPDGPRVPPLHQSRARRAGGGRGGARTVDGDSSRTSRCSATSPTTSSNSSPRTPSSFTTPRSTSAFSTPSWGGCRLGRIPWIACVDTLGSRARGIRPAPTASTRCASATASTTRSAPSTARWSTRCCWPRSTSSCSASGRRRSRFRRRYRHAARRRGGAIAARPSRPAADAVAGATERGGCGRTCRLRRDAGRKGDLAPLLRPRRRITPHPPLIATHSRRPLPLGEVG